MKFLQLEILNLASLDKQGGEVINFEEGALALPSTTAPLATQERKATRIRT